MTPHEFMLCVQGYGRRQLEDMQKRAWEVAHHVSMWSKDPVSPAELLGERKQRMFVSEQDWRDHMREKKRRVEEKKRMAKRRQEDKLIGS